MRVNKHIVEGVEFVPARQIGGVIKPEIVVLHDTAGRLDKFNSRDYLARSSQVSVHFVVERDGTISQLVPTNRRAAHAGASSFNGRRDCNAFSIGIEIVNPGRMERVGRNSCRAWWGEEFGIGFELTEADEVFSTVEMSTPHHGAGVWMDYTEEQIAAVEALLHVLFRDLPSLKDITTHWYISPGRKVDTNPLFPLQDLRARILGRDDPADEAADAQSVEQQGADFVEIVVPASTLNLRRWPSFNPNVLVEIPNGAIVPVLRVGTDGAAKGWLKVVFGGQEGWIVSRYTKPAPKE